MNTRRRPGTNAGGDSFTNAMTAAWSDHDGHPHSDALRTTERYHRRDCGNLDLEVTSSNPSIYPKPWTVKVRAELAADTEMIEFVCSENGKGVQHWVGKADEKKSRGESRSRDSGEVRGYLC